MPTRRGRFGHGPDDTITDEELKGLIAVARIIREALQAAGYTVHDSSTDPILEEHERLHAEDERVMGIERGDEAFSLSVAIQP